MQTFREEHNEHRIDKLEERVNILEAGVLNDFDHSTTTFKAILEALETIHRITENLDERVQRLENIVLVKEENEEDS